MFRKLVHLCLIVLVLAFAGTTFAQDYSAMWNQMQRWKHGVDPMPPNTLTEVPTEVGVNPQNTDSPPNRPDIQVFNYPPAQYWQSENSIGVNYSNPNQVMVSTNGQIPNTTICVWQPWAFSTDGGSTWPTSLQSEAPPPPITGSFGDPVAFFDRSSRAYYVTLGATGGCGTGQGIFVVSTTNFGANWSAQSQADVAASSGDDKEHAAADFSGTFPNNVYAAWTDFNRSGSPVVFSRSTNQGATWLPGTVLQIGANRGQGVHIAIGPNGEVYVMWAHYTSGTAEVGIGIAKSTDGGATFNTPAIAYPINGIRISNGGITALNGTRAASFPYFDVDRSTGGRRGWVYAVTPELDVATTGQADIYVHRSSDGGATWMSAVKINGPDVVTGRWQWMPSIAVDPTTGGVTVSYYSFDSTGSTTMANRWAAYSVDGGATWDNWVISDVRATWAPQLTPNTNTVYNGDYYETTAMGGTAWALWTDRRSGSSGSNNRAYIEKIIYGQNFGWVRGTVTSTAGGAPVSGVGIDFVDNVLQQGGLTSASGQYLAGALVDTPATTAQRTLRARKFGYVDTTIVLTLTRNDTITRNFQVRPAPGGTLSVYSHTATTNLRSYVEVKFGTLVVVSDSTNGTTGILTAPLPTGTYSVRVDAPSPYRTLNFPSVVITANQTTNVNALTSAVLQNSPSAMRDTLAVGATHQKTLQLTNTSTDSVPWRLSGEETLMKPYSPGEFRAIERSQKQQPSYTLPKGVEDTRSEPANPVGIDGRGGPDAFGYVWIDSDDPGGPQYNWVDIVSVGTPVTSWTGSTDDGYFATTLPWPFPFYGNTYTNFFITTNGWLGFNAPSTEYTNVAIPNTAAPNNAIYAWWDDLQATGTSGDGTVYYYNDAANSRYIVQYNNVRHLSATADTLKFQLILKQNGEVLMQYNRMVATTNLISATIGLENATGTVGLQVVHNAAYMHNNLAIIFKLRGISWLTYSPSSGILPPSGLQNVTATFNATGLNPGTTYNGITYLDATHPDVQGSTNIPSSLRVQAATQPLLILNKDSINYGATLLGTTKRDSVMARNGGAQTLNITSITSNNARFVVTPANATLPPGDSVKIRINYTPTVPSIDTGRVIILSNSSSGSRRDILLRGSGFGMARITAVPDSFTFTRQAGSDTARATFKIKNTGTDTLRYVIDERAGFTLSSMVRSQTQQPTHELAKGEIDPSSGDPQLDGGGGPDAFGYIWIDSDEPGGPPYSWFDIKSVGTQITTWTGGTPDDGYATVTIPFSFPFYGNNYTSMNVGTNGHTQFGGGTSTAYANSALPTTAVPNNDIYAFWDDLNFNEVGGTLWYYYDAANQRFIVQYDSVSHYLPATTPGRYTFQMVLKPTGDILCYYRKMEGTVNSATIGIENSTGMIGLQTVFDAAYMHDNLAILFTKDAVSWLSTNRTTGTIVQSDSQNVEVRIHPPAALPGGQYTANLRITGNTTDTVKVRVRLTVTTDVQQTANLVPTTYELNQNYPNPFNPTTKISFALPQESRIRLKVYNLLGQEVTTLADEVQPAGYFSVVWNGHNSYGRSVASGIYFYRLEATSADGKTRFMDLKKMILLK